jgi:two-component system, NarL family, response regulator LiaR
MNLRSGYDVDQNINSDSFEAFMGADNLNYIKVLIADDHPMLRQGIREGLERQPDFKVIGEASDGEEAVKLASDLKPDVIVMDIGMPKMSGLEATRKIKTLYKNIAVVVLTIHDDKEYIQGLLQAGATGYLLKSAYSKQLVQTIRAVCAGSFAFDPLVGQKLIQFNEENPANSIRVKVPAEFTGKEIEVLKLLAAGKSNKDIAVELGVKVRTVKSHLEAIFNKMGVSSRTEAVLHAIQQGWIVTKMIPPEPIP